MIQWNKLSIDRKEYLLGVITTNSTPTVLTTNQSPVTGTNQIVVPAATGMKFEAVVVGLSGATVFVQVIKGVIKTTAGTTALVGSNIVTDKWADSGASTWVAAATADNVNKALTITVTGQAATTINWFALITTIEVT